MPRVPDRGVQPDEAGFTLIEMMVTVVIMGIIIAPLTMLLIQSMLVRRDRRRRWAICARLPSSR